MRLISIQVTDEQYAAIKKAAERIYQPTVTSWCRMHIINAIRPTGGANLPAIPSNAAVRPSNEV